MATQAGQGLGARGAQTQAGWKGAGGRGERNLLEPEMSRPEKWVLRRGALGSGGSRFKPQVSKQRDNGPVN